MKRQTEKSQILSTYVLLAQELGYMYLKNSKKSSMTEPSKEFLLDTRERIFIGFIIPLLEKSTRSEMLI